MIAPPNIDDLYRQAREPVICTGCGNEYAEHADEIRQARRNGWEIHPYSPGVNVNSKQLLELLDWLTSNDQHIDSHEGNE
jgi:hypothetical protein